MCIRYREKEKDKSSVMWFQSMDDPQTAFPVMQPNHVCPDYNPMVSDEMLRPLGGMTEDNTYVLVTLTAAPDPKDTSVTVSYTHLDVYKRQVLGLPLGCE